jgi:class 3 adenylate cyclase
MRRWVFSADRSIVNNGGLVGRHAGDGVTAFFLAESLGSESEAARACIAAARSIRQAALTIAEGNEIDPSEVVTRFGLHWGSTLYVGAISTQGRYEVTALGDQVNEAARIEACASGGRTLASKELIERLSKDDAIALGIDVKLVNYFALGALSTATEKARRDAPVLAVCDV